MTGSRFLYLDVPSPLHRLHPAAKIISMLALFAGIMAFNDPLWELAWFGAALLTIALARAWSVLFRMRWFLLLIMAMSALMWALFLRDDVARKMLPEWSWGPFHITRGTLLFGAAMALRIGAFLIVGLAFIASTRPEQLAFGLRCLGVPPTVSAAVTLSFSLLPHFLTTAFLVRQAQLARGLELRRISIWRRFARSVSVIVPVLGYALRRAEDLSNALDVWGFGAGPHSYIDARRAGAVEIAQVVFCIALAAACIWARVVMGYGELLPRL